MADNGVLILGSTGKAGYLLAEALAPDTPVAVMHRREDQRAEFEAFGASVLIGDAMDRDSMFAVAAESNCDTLVSLIGGIPFNEPDTWPDYTGNVNAMDAALAAGMQRFLFVTSIGTGSSMQWVPENSSFLMPILELKTRAEDYLKQSALDWTIIKPGGLIDKFDESYEIADEQLVVTVNPAIRGVVTRKLLADVTKLALENPATTKGKELHVVGDQIEVFDGEATPFEFGG